MPRSEPLPSTSYLEAVIAGQMRRFLLQNDRVCSIGRGASNTIVLDDDMVSRRHAMLERSDAGELHIIDMSSTNGTSVNGKRVTVPMALRPGDHIQIGSHDFVLHEEGASKSAVAKAEPEYASTVVLFALKLVTVVVVDIRGFSELANSLDSAKLAALLGSFFRAAGKALSERGAFAQKYIGDAVMGVWIHSASRPAVTEMLSILQGVSALTRIVAGLQDEFALASPVTVTAGANTGMASVGNIGSLVSADYTALGDVVNKAFRLQSMTRELAVDLLVGEQTFTVLTELSHVRSMFERHSVLLKGYEQPEVAYGAQFMLLESLIANLTRSPIATL